MRALRRSPSLHVLLVLAASAACLRDGARYSPARDDAAMLAIAAAFAEGQPAGLALSLCEDVAASEGWAPGCRYQHVVQGGGRGLAHEESHSEVGCGGCPFQVAAYVVGTASGGPFAAPVAVRGIVTLQSGHDDDPYALPYRLALRCDDPGAACAIDGELRRSGELALTVVPEDAAGAPLSTTSQVLARSGAGACAPP